MTDRGAWSTSPVALLLLDPDGRITDTNETFLAWLTGLPSGPRSVGAGTGGAPVPQPTGDPPWGRRLADLLTVGGRIYWDTHVAPALALGGRVEEVAVELRTTTTPLPVLLSAHQRPAVGSAAGPVTGPVIEVAMFATRGRAEFERELVRARASSERLAQRLRWVHDATAALSREAGTGQVRAALLSAVAQHPAVADVRLQPPGTGIGDDAHLTAAVLGVNGSHGDLVVTLHHRPADSKVDPDALTTIAAQGAVALDRARLHEQSMSVAHELQHAMLAVDLPTRDDLTVSAEYRPAVRGLEVGGDWYDVFPVGPTTLAFVVGDVVGHGLAAATAMGQLRTAARALARPGLGPARVLDLLHGFVTDHDVGFGSTIAYAELDTATSTLTYATAGHLPPLLVRAAGATTYLWDGRSTPLGVRAGDQDREEGTTVLGAGDVVALYTDGVVERRDRTLPDGMGVLAAHAGTPPDPGDSLAAHLIGPGTYRDDACVLVLWWHGPR